MGVKVCNAHDLCIAREDMQLLYHMPIIVKQNFNQIYTSFNYSLCNIIIFTSFHNLANPEGLTAYVLFSNSWLYPYVNYGLTLIFNHKILLTSSNLSGCSTGG